MANPEVARSLAATRADAQTADLLPNQAICPFLRQGTMPHRPPVRFDADPAGSRCREFRLACRPHANPARTLPRPTTLAHFVLRERRNGDVPGRFVSAGAILDEKDRSDHQTVQA
jgi:hypothetical protein